MAADHQALEEEYVGEDDLLFDGEDDVLGDTPESEGRYYDDIQEVSEGPIHELANRVGKEQRELAAIPEADTPSRKSKRRNESVNEHSLEHARRIKAACNLDFASDKGTNSKPISSFFTIQMNMS
jgi:hypothetical protein